MNARDGRRWRVAAVLGTLLVALSLQAAPAAADPPPWAHAGGHHRYVYYPRQQVYFAPETQLWFWLSGGNWRVGASLPQWFRVDDGPSVFVTLAGDRPYRSHGDVRERYPDWPGDRWRDRDDDWRHDDHRGRGHDRRGDEHDGDPGGHRERHHDR